MNSPEPDDPLLEKVVDEFTHQLRQGKHPSIAQYQKRYPHLADEIHELLSSVAMIEQLKTPVDSGNSLNQRLNDTLEIRQLGDYKLLREIGRGGMGIVFEAIHQSLGRQVAIKILPNRSGGEQKQVDRFRREAQAAARLHHPNIVNVFGVGFDQGHHYYVMEYVDGTSLKQTIVQWNQRLQKTRTGSSADRLTDPPPSSISTSPTDDTFVEDSGHRMQAPVQRDEDGRERSSDQGASWILNSETPYLPEPGKEIPWALEAMAGIADALDYAHHNKLLHRDIKPANLLVDHSGTVRLTDFGLAKHLELNDLTQTGDLVGTPQYMPPESLEGKYDQRSEVYGLGLVLYELVTGKTAFEPASTAGILHQITTLRPRAPRSINPAISSDLEVVIQKAIARDPQDRYATAAALRDDLRCIVNDRPISARRPSTWEQVRRWARRNPTSAALATLSLVLLGLISLTTTVGYFYIQSAYNELEQQHRLLENQQRETETARQQAVANEQRIQHEYDRAQANLQVSIQAFDEIFLQLVAPDRLQLNDSGAAIELDIDGLNELAGIQSSVSDQDAQFLKRMLTFYQQIADQNAEQPEMKQQSAKASRRVANTYHLIGNMEEASKAYQQTIQQYEQLLAESPTSAPIAHTLAQVYNEAGQASRRARSKTALAVRLHQQARRLLIEHPASDTRSMKLELARTYNLLCASETEPPTETLAITEDVFGLLNKQSNAWKRIAQRRNEQRQRLMENLKLRERMLVNLDQAIRITEELLAIQTDDPEVRLVHAISLRSKAMLSQDAEQVSHCLTQAVADLEQLSKQHPDPEYAYELAVTLTLADDKQRSQNDDLAVAQGLLENLIQQYPRNLEYQQLNLAVQLERARLFFENKETDALSEALSNAMESLSVLVQASPDQLRYRFEFAYVSYAQAKFLMDADKGREAQRTLMQAISTINRLRSSDQDPALRQATRQTLIRLYDVLAEVYRGLGDNRRERQAWNEARKLEKMPRPNRPRPPQSQPSDSPL